jgi:hypothetical protein
MRQTHVGRRTSKTAYTLLLKHYSMHPCHQPSIWRLDLLWYRQMPLYSPESERECARLLARTNRASIRERLIADRCECA